MTLVLLLSILVLGAPSCGDTPIAAVATAPPSPTDTPVHALNLSDPNPAQGRQAYIEKQCVACHGDVGQGGIGPVLANSPLPFDQFLHAVRTAVAPKPRYNAAELSDQEVYNIYAWFETLDPSNVLLQPPASSQLAEGEILGMTLWVSYECDSCHGSFAQGSKDAPPLSSISYPYEMERANMRLTGDKIPQHKAEFIRDKVLKRLYKWLQEGAKPAGGC